MTPNMASLLQSSSPGGEASLTTDQQPAFSDAGDALIHLSGRGGGFLGHPGCGAVVIH